MTESSDSLSTAPSSPNSSISSLTVSSPPTSPTAMLKSPVNKALIAVKKPTLAHPSTAVMVTAAIKSLKDKKGSTLQGIKKYIAINYQVDTGKSAPFIRKYLKSAVAKGELIQTNGTGATGNFKLRAEVKKPAVKKKPDVVATSKKKPEVKKPTAKKTPTVASGKRRAIEEEKKTTATVSNAKKPKKVATADAKPKAKKVVEVVPKTVPSKTKKETPATKTNNTKVAAKKVPVKKVAPKKK